MAESLAILIPSFNGGALLAESVASCVHADFAADDCAVHVVDNASTDGSLDALPDSLANGVRVHLHRAATNVGRIGNWNAAMQVARDRGARYALFLFVGDLLLPGGGLDACVRAMRDADALAAVAPNAFLDADGRQTATARRVRLPSGRTTVRARALAQAALARGAMFFGPLQAHVFRTDAAHAPHFDAADPTHTDQAAVFRLMLGSAAPVVLHDRPFFGWRAHAARFHAGMKLDQRIRSDLALLGQLAAEQSHPLDWTAIRASLFLQYAAVAVRRGDGGRHPLRTAWTTLRAHGPISIAAMAGLLVRRARGRTLVELNDCT